jgi:hypothetical protein
MLISPSIPSPIAILAIPLSNATRSRLSTGETAVAAMAGKPFSPLAILAHACPLPWADDPIRNRAYLRPVDAQIGRFLRRDAPSAAARGAILQPSRFRAINSVFGHLRPGERNVLDDLSPIL